VISSASHIRPALRLACAGLCDQSKRPRRVINTMTYYGDHIFAASNSSRNRELFIVSNCRYSGAGFFDMFGTHGITWGQRRYTGDYDRYLALFEDEDCIDAYPYALSSHARE
jgi:hypothetical protein